MGKKVKVGKQRRDKAYWAAKEIGYRSRASFKLVQLNRKWEFLQKSNVVIDLCAAPGSWMQVAKECTPVTSIVVGVDLVPIKPINGCIALQGDITTEKCKADLRKELKTAKADCVLHDGAPNVGKSWVHDAYQQSLLTLHSFRLATVFLVRGGWFVTKVFRSKDYQSLMWVFKQFFKKVHATKPAASRNESAEIFVVCQHYLAPDKIDPKFLDPRHVFSEVEEDNKKVTRELVNPEKKKKPGSEGYQDGATMLYREAKASDFIMGNSHIEILNTYHKIVLDAPRIIKHKRTTAEIKECLNDIKVLGMKEFRQLKKWRDALRKEFEEEDEKNKGKEEAVPAVLKRTAEEEEDEELAELDRQVEELKDQERRADRRKKKKELKEKQKRHVKLNLKMIIPGDEGPTHQEENLFKMSDLKTKEDVNSVVDQRPDAVVDSDSEEAVRRPKFEQYDKEHKMMDSEGLWYGEGEEDDKSDSDSSDEEGGEDLGLQDEAMQHDDVDVAVQDKPSENPLMESLETDSAETKRARKAELWFDKIDMGGIDEDSDLEDAELQNTIESIEKKGGKIRTKKKSEAPVAVPDQPTESGYTSGSEEEPEDNKEVDDSDSDSDSDSDYEQDWRGGGGQTKGDGFEIVPQKKVKKRQALSAEELALGEQLVQSKKRKRDIMDSGWNRYMFDDTGLPDWFVKEEEFHMRKRLDVDPATVEKYIERSKEINVKTIKKVVEAKARRKRRVAKRMEKAKKKASHIIENEDIGSREKASEIKRLYRKAAAAGKPKEVSYVVAKKHMAAKRARRPAAVKGPYKQVDPRMKKDNKGKRNNASGKKNQKRRLKGKQAKPTKQFNTNR